VYNLSLPGPAPADEPARRDTEEMPLFGPGALRRLDPDLGRLTADPLRARPVDDDYCDFGLGPGDSHYDLSPSFVDFPNHDPRADTHAQSIVSTHSEPTHAAPLQAAATLSREPESAIPANVRLLDVWARHQLPATLGFGGLALLFFGLFLIRVWTDAPAGDGAILTLLVGIVGMIAFIFVSLMAAVLSAIMAQLVRELRRLSDELHG
jgi:hypothetical protein